MKFVISYSEPDSHKGAETRFHLIKEDVSPKNRDTQCVNFIVKTIFRLLAEEKKSKQQKIH